MISVEDQSDIESAFRGFGRLFAVEQQKEISRMGKRWIRLDYILPFANAVIGRDNHGNLGSQPDGLADVGVVIVFLVIRIVKRQGRNRCAQTSMGATFLGALQSKLMIPGSILRSAASF